MKLSQGRFRLNIRKSLISGTPSISEVSYTQLMEITREQPQYKGQHPVFLCNPKGVFLFRLPEIAQMACQTKK